MSLLQITTASKSLCHGQNISKYGILGMVYRYINPYKCRDDYPFYGKITRCFDHIEEIQLQAAPKQCGKKRRIRTRWQHSLHNDAKRVKNMCCGSKSHQFISHMVHVRNIYLHLHHKWPKCRSIYYTWSIWVLVHCLHSKMEVSQNGATPSHHPFYTF